MADELKVVDSLVISMDYTLTVDGQVIDTSEGHEPIEFIQGTGNIIPGLERELYDMLVGDTKTVVVAPKDGYGEVDTKAFMEVPRSEFPANISMDVGSALEMHDENGQPVHATIVAVGDETVRLDFNHPMAGKDLHFFVKIAKIRVPSAQELIDGHVHPGGGHAHHHEH